MEGDRESFRPIPSIGISIHTLRMEGDDDLHNFAMHCQISIHTLRMEGDKSRTENTVRDFLISIHTLRMEGDISIISIILIPRNFNPHPPHGG